MARQILASAEPALTDLGALHERGETAAVTSGAQIEPRLRSPEHTEGRVLDPRSDLWSVAVLLYRGLSGTWPFDGETEAEMTAAITRRPHANVSTVAPAVGAAFDGFFAKALKKDAVDRYQTAQSMLEAFRAAVEASEQPASQLPPVNAAQRATELAPRSLVADSTPANQPAPTFEEPKRSRTYVLALVLVSLVGVAVYLLLTPEDSPVSYLVQPPGEQVGPPANTVPELELPGKKEVTLPLSEPFILNVWLERCADCMPVFDAWSRLAEADELPSAPIVNVSAYKPADEGWAERYRVDEQLVWDRGPGLIGPLGVRRFTTFVVRPSGEIVFRGHADQAGFKEALERALDDARR
jgi:hypothetical protein